MARKLTLLLCLLACAGSAFAQVTATPPVPSKAGPVPAAPGIVVSPGPVDPKARPEGAAAPAADSPRLTRLRQLTFDRRPSAVLKAWAPPPKDDKPAPPPKDPKSAELDKELAAFQKDVTLGNWAGVKRYLESLPDEEAVAGYQQLLRNLQQRPGMGGPGGPGGDMEGQMMMSPAAMQFGERHVFSPDDVRS